MAVPKAILQVALRLQGQYESMLWSLLLRYVAGCRKLFVDEYVEAFCNRYRICEAEAYSGESSLPTCEGVQVTYGLLGIA